MPSENAQRFRKIFLQTIIPAVYSLLLAGLSIKSQGGIDKKRFNFDSSPLEKEASRRVWTDDYSDVLSILKFPGVFSHDEH